MQPLKNSIINASSGQALTMLNQAISKQFSHRWIRDLAWALLSPSFFSQLPEDNDTGLFTQETLTPIWQDDELLPWLNTLDKNPDALTAHMQTQRATRLGVYFEQLLSFYFSHYPHFRLLAKNLQANDNKRTIGEYGVSTKSLDVVTCPLQSLDLVHDAVVT